jgi:hypothetical protein
MYSVKNIYLDLINIVKDFKNLLTIKYLNEKIIINYKKIIPYKFKNINALRHIWLFLLLFLKLKRCMNLYLFSYKLNFWIFK